MIKLINNNYYTNKTPRSERPSVKMLAVKYLAMMIYLVMMMNEKRHGHCLAMWKLLVTSSWSLPGNVIPG